MMPAALDRGLLLLEVVCRSPQPISFTRLMRELGGLNRASLSRLLKGLVSSGHLQKDPDNGLYSPGHRLAVFSGVKSPGRGEALIRRYAELMRDLSEKHDLTCILQERVKDVLVAIHKTQTEYSAVMQNIGFVNVEPTQIWMLVMAAFHKDAYQVYLDNPQLHHHLTHIDKIRDQGYAYDDCKGRRNFRRLGFPIHNGAGRFIGVMGMGGNPSLLTEEIRYDLTQELPQRLTRTVVP